MPWPKGKPFTSEMIAKQITIRTKWDWLPAQKIVERLLHTNATVRSIAAEYGCSKSTIDKIFRRYTTLDDRLVTKYRKQSASLRGHKFDRPCKSPNPQAIKARTAVNNAVRDGRLPRPTQCQQFGCHMDGRIEAHHWHGYDDEHLLDVVWLCSKHHRFADTSPRAWSLTFELLEAK